MYKKLINSCQQLANVDLNQINCKELAKNFLNIPVILIYSRKDKFVESSDSMKIFNQITTNYKLFIDCNVSHSQPRPIEKINKI